MTSSMASKIAHTSDDFKDVNRKIPPEWETKEAIIRLRKADFPKEKDHGSSSSKKTQIPRRR